MRKRQIYSGLIIAAFACICGGCGKNTESEADKSTVETIVYQETESVQDGTGDTQEAVEETSETIQGAVDYEEIYSSLIKDYAQLLLSGEAENPLVVDGGVAVQSIYSIFGQDEAPAQVGYRIEDLSGDGIPELLIGDVQSMENGIGYGSLLYAVYTCKEQEPVLSFCGYERSSYQFLGNGRVLNQGSSGAAYSCFGTFHLSTDGTELVCEDFYFTSPKDDSFAEIGCYHDTTDEWEIERAEEVSEDAFWDLENTLLQQIQMLEFMPFSEYIEMQGTEISDVEEPETDTEVYVGWNSDSTIIFYADAIVEDFKILSLSLETVDENGKCTFLVEEERCYGTLVPRAPLILGLEMIGTIPNNGISYINSRGETKTYAIEVSGYDGSLFLTEIDI